MHVSIEIIIIALSVERLQKEPAGLDTGILRAPSPTSININTQIRQRQREVRRSCATTTTNHKKGCLIWVASLMHSFCDV
jgi:hypothetical protein